MLRPRRRQDCPAPLVVVTPELLDSVRDMSLVSAAATVGLSATAFKRACRKLGVRRWTYQRRPGPGSLSPNRSGDAAGAGDPRCGHSVSPLRPARALSPVTRARGSPLPGAAVRARGSPLPGAALRARFGVAPARPVRSLLAPPSHLGQLEARADAQAAGLGYGASESSMPAPIPLQPDTFDLEPAPVWLAGGGDGAAEPQLWDAERGLTSSESSTEAIEQEPEVLPAGDVWGDGWGGQAGEDMATDLADAGGWADSEEVASASGPFQCLEI